MYFGAPVWPIQWYHPYDEPIKRIARLGFQAVELIAWTPDVVTEYYTGDTIRKLKDLISGEGLVLSNFSRSVHNLSSDDPKLRQEGMEDFKRAVGVVKELGSPVITSVSPYPFNLDVPRIMSRPVIQEWIVDVARDLDWTANYNLYVDAIAQACEYAKQAGLKYAIEPHPFRWINTAQGMMRLIERSGADNLGMNLDPSHLFPSGEIPHYTIYVLGQKVFHTHFSDNDAQTNAHWRPGKGKVDWRAAMRALKDVGYDGAISFELEDVPGAAHRGIESTPDLDRELKLSMAYIKAIADEEGIKVTR